MSKSRDLAKTAGLKDVVLTGTFDTTGIDDNATSNQVTISDTGMVVVGDVDAGALKVGGEQINISDVPARNSVLNVDPLYQGSSSRAGMSSKIYIGSGGTQSIDTGIDMATGDFGGWVWLKERGGVDHHYVYDTVRGVNQQMYTNLTDSEYSATGAVTTFNTTGFSLGSSASVNGTTETYVAWSWQTTKKKEPTYAANLLTGDSSDFTSGLGTWVIGSSVTLSTPSNVLRLTNTTTVGGWCHSGSLTTIIGETYLVTIDLTSVATSDGEIYLGTTGGDTDLGTKVYNSIGTKTISFVATTTTSFIALSNISAITGDYTEWDNISVKEITNNAKTNRGKPYTAHYNPDMNFSIVGYEGDGQDGHEIPHHLGVVPELSIFKSRDSVNNWLVKSLLFGIDENLQLDETGALATSVVKSALFSDSSVTIDTSIEFNASAINYISYHFASKSGVCKIGKYIGTGATGNYVSTEVDGGDAFKPSWIMVKNLTSVGNWLIIDSIRPDDDLYADLSNAEGGGGLLNMVNDGIKIITPSSTLNTLNAEYIFMAFAESSIDASKAIADYDYPTTADILSITDNTLVTVANGFNSLGQVDTQYQFGIGITKAYGATHESKHYYLYTDKVGVLGETEVRPLVGITRDDADKYGVVSPSDKTLRTNSKHFDYESDSGVALASGSYGGNYPSWWAFNVADNDIITSATNWLIDTTTDSWLQYKHTEKRILKSWRIREGDTAGREPQRFTIEGSNDGNTWTSLDSTYTNFNYTAAGVHLWGDLHSTSGNSNAYLYHRINITANGSDGIYTSIEELEFNTILASDYYLVEEGKSYNSSGVPQEKVYLGEFKTDADGDVIKDSIINYPIGGQEFSDVAIHGDLVVHGDIHSKGICTAWVTFDGNQNPPLINDSFNVKDVVDLGTGLYKVLFDEPMEDISYAVALTSTDGSSRGIPSENTAYSSVRGFGIYNTYDAAIPIDASKITAIVTGGKKIK